MAVEKHFLKMNIIVTFLIYLKNDLLSKADKFLCQSNRRVIPFGVLLTNVFHNLGINLAVRWIQSTFGLNFSLRRGEFLYQIST